jgi:macrophage erythroblast attacher
VEDPLHLPTYQALAAGLPYAKHLHSKLVCHITKQLMNEDDPPMVLPNGYVYSLKVTFPMARK